MPRIAGIDLPRNKRIEIALTYIYGIGRTSSQKILIKGIQSFTLKRYTLQQTAASNDLETKQLQLELRSVRTGPAKAFASNNVISARFIMRNKPVSN